ncbi:MAG TPA: ABC transporter ATP-binding protein [Nitrospirota bacterium]|nr:ABC transporter ATP-binding protein [Nitrospirota bacterium]
MTQILLKNVTKSYPGDAETVSAVNGASLSVSRGEFVSIVGHSGSGKTTLLSLIGGIVRPTSGGVLFEGGDIFSLNSDELSAYRAEKIGFMFQFASLLPMLTVKENLILPTLFSAARGEETDGASRQNKAEKLVRMVGLGEKLNSYPAQLSGGQQRRVAIARAFMNDPAVILADEPTGDLDEETEQDMMDFFKSMNRSEGITFLMVTHNTDLANQARRKLRMHKGVLEEHP